MKRFNDWLYKDGRPNAVARILNRISAILYASDRTLDYVATLSVTGRKSGKLITFPVVVITMNDDDYLVAMLGEKVNWVKNVRAAGGRATFRKGVSSPVLLTEVPPESRTPILQRYLQVATSGRTHFPVSPDAKVAEIDAIAGDYPVFRIDRTGPAGGEHGRHDD